MRFHRSRGLKPPNFGKQFKIQNTLGQGSYKTQKFLTFFFPMPNAQCPMPNE
ncbi:MAG: hypothetical protein ACRAVC_00585 [Trichormus sp.]